MRLENARVSLEKNKAVRAFCTETSHENRVASGVRKVPSTTGGCPGWSGLLTTEMNVSAGCPAGSRIPARVTRVRAAALAMIDETSAAVNRGWPSMSPATGSPVIGARTSPRTPPRSAVGQTTGAGASRPAGLGATADGSGPAVLATYGRRIPSMKMFVATMSPGGSKPIWPARATRSFGSGPSMLPFSTSASVPVTPIPARRVPSR